MEIQFQLQHNSHKNPTNSINKPKNKLKNRTNKKFVGVRQRPSGRWVAEIKDTTQKIRMWLGTFETAEEAARAYDEAARLLRGSNTRTNFNDTNRFVSSTSPLASRVRDLLSKRQITPSSSTTSSSSGIVTSAPSNVTTQATTTTTTTCSINDDDYVYKPDLSNVVVDDDQLVVVDDDNHHHMGCCSKFDSFSWSFASSGYLYDEGFSFSATSRHESDMSAKNLCNEEYQGMEFTEFDRMKVERQISASLYAMNGVQEYMDTVHESNSNEGLWDRSALCSFFC